ncbi:MAG TPA: hypothetical protein VMH06_00065 [Thermodesulfovibrionales bacterium]|nr:hypothetical protein [Thermodesulfovibrionales bacterium]
MKFIVVDYSGYYYSIVAKRPVPGILRGKFVLIRKGATEYLVLSPREFTPYHADIVERFCNEKGIEGTYEKGKKRYDIDDPAWVIAGGGKFEIDRVKRSVRFYDDSMAYGKFEGGGLREQVSRNPVFKGYTLGSE